MFPNSRIAPTEVYRSGLQQQSDGTAPQQTKSIKIRKRVCIGAVRSIPCQTSGFISFQTYIPFYTPWERLISIPKMVNMFKLLLAWVQTLQDTSKRVVYPFQVATCFLILGWQGGLGGLRLPLQYGDMLPQSAYEYLRTVTADLTVYLLPHASALSWKVELQRFLCDIHNTFKEHQLLRNLEEEKKPRGTYLIAMQVSGMQQRQGIFSLQQKHPTRHSTWQVFSFCIRFHRRLQELSLEKSFQAPINGSNDS